jgi:hypothetical protein
MIRRRDEEEGLGLALNFNPKTQKVHLAVVLQFLWIEDG